MNAGIFSLTTTRPLTRPTLAADQHAADERERHRQADGGHQLGADHGAEARDGADRQVELAADEQDRLADGDDADEGNDGEDRADVAVGEERRLEDVEEEDDHHERREHADFADRDHPYGSGAPQGCVCVGPDVRHDLVHANQLPFGNAGLLLPASPSRGCASLTTQLTVPSYYNTCKSTSSKASPSLRAPVLPAG